MGVRDDDEILIVSRHAMIIRVLAKEIRVHGRATMGVRLMKLNEEDSVQTVVVLKE